MTQRNMFVSDIKKQRVAGTFTLINNVPYMLERGSESVFWIEYLINTKGRNLKFIPLITDIKTENYIVTKKYAYFSKPVKLLLKKLRI